jgi:hypothetical protein
METLLLTGIGVAALGYVTHTVWRGLSGKEACNCADSGSCPTASAGCRCPAPKLPK